MSISGALSNALSGLTANSRAVEVVSSNLANVLTEGYGTRDIALTAQSEGRGVSVLGVTRYVDQGLLSDRRLADSGVAYADTRTSFITELERVVGTPDNEGSLTGRIAAFESSLVSSSSRPEATERLQAAVQRAGELIEAITSTSDKIQSLRTNADGDIARSVDTINTTLTQIRELNIRIGTARNNGHQTAAIEDQRQVAIDRLAEFVPLRQVPRDNGAVALFTPGGAILLDGTAAQLDFTSSNVVAPHMTLEGGLLSGLTINGISVNTSGNNSPISGGRLEAYFNVRDTLAVDAQEQVDAVARDLIERFQQPGLDATRAPGDPGLFTDAGALFDPADEVGIAGRLALNRVVDPDAGGALWRLRDGLGATAPGPAGNGALLQQLTATLNEDRSLSSPILGPNARSVAGHAASLVSQIGQDRLTLDQNLSFATAQQNELTTLELQDGVDSDAQLQRLLLVEQAFGANARMIQTVDELIQTLLRI